MYSRLSEVVAYIDRQRPDLERAVADVPVSDWARRPAPERWSVAQVLEHLVLVERSLARTFAKWLAEHREQGRGPEGGAAPTGPEMDIARALDRKRSMKASATFEPKDTLTVPDAWRALDDARRALKDTLAAGHGLALDGIVRPHPGLGPLNMYGWIAFVGAHMARHTAQIREIGEALRLPSDAGEVPREVPSDV
jgi:hypothetical protein